MQSPGDAGRPAVDVLGLPRFGAEVVGLAEALSKKPAFAKNVDLQFS